MTAKLTQKQFEVLSEVRQRGVVSSEGNGAQLRSLAKKGLVVQHHNSHGQNVSYTWTAANSAKGARRL